MKFKTLFVAACAAGFLAVSANTSEAGLFDWLCHDDDECCPPPTCCQPAYAPTCCGPVGYAPAPTPSCGCGAPYGYGAGHHGVGYGSGYYGAGYRGAGYSTYAYGVHNPAYYPTLYRSHTHSEFYGPGN